MTRLEHARGLASARKWSDLAALADRVEQEEVEHFPELAYLLADGLRRTGRIDRARPLALAADRSAFRAADSRLALRTLNLLGMLAFEAGRMEEADMRFSALRERAAQSADDEFTARACNNLGIIANIRGQTELALTAYKRALAAYQRIGYARGLAQTYYNLGISYRDLGFADDADAHFSRSIQHADESGSEDVIALAETERAALRARVGDGDLAESIASRALARLERMNDPAGAANAIRVLALAANARGARELALERLDQALATLASHPDPLLRAEIHRDRGTLLRDLPNLAGAREELRRAISGYEEIGAQAEAETTRQLLERITSPDATL